MVKGQEKFVSLGRLGQDQTVHDKDYGTGAAAQVRRLIAYCLFVCQGLYQPIHRLPLYSMPPSVI